MNSRTGPPGPPETMHSPGGVGRPILSQSEDQSRPHPVLTFVHPMSTQVRCLGPDTAESAHRSDPRIATRTRKRVSRQAANYPENWIKLFGCVSRGPTDASTTWIHARRHRGHPFRVSASGTARACGHRGHPVSHNQPVRRPGQGPTTRGPPAPVISFIPLALY